MIILNRITEMIKFYDSYDSVDLSLLNPGDKVWINDRADNFFNYDYSIFDGQSLRHRSELFGNYTLIEFAYPNRSLDYHREMSCRMNKTKYLLDLSKINLSKFYSCDYDEFFLNLQDGNLPKSKILYFTFEDSGEQYLVYSYGGSDVNTNYFTKSYLRRDIISVIDYSIINRYEERIISDMTMKNILLFETVV